MQTSDKTGRQQAYKQARKSSEDAQAGYAQFEKSLDWVTFGSKKFGP